MESKTQAQLTLARAYFYAWKMPEAYNILRRYFDRLPFQPEAEHAEYVGMFCRVLMELGKEFELKFYLQELERIYERTRNPHIAYTLGVVYSYSNEPRSQASKTLFEEILRSHPTKRLAARTKMMLADYYLTIEDVTSCRMIINSIEPSDPETDLLVQVWEGATLRREKRCKEAIEHFDRMLATLTFEKDSYAYLSAKIIYAMTLLDLKENDRVEVELEAIKVLIQGKNLKSTEEQLKRLNEKLSKRSGIDPIRFEPGEGQSAFVYAERRVFINEQSPCEKLFLLLLKKGFLDKAQIVKALYGRQYKPDDDKLIYYHIHTLRKRLKELGVPSEAILTEDDGYRLVPEVQTV